MSDAFTKYRNGFGFHPDGRAKKFGDLSADEQGDVLRGVCRRLQDEFNNPDVQQKLAAVLDGKRVDN